MPRFFQWISCGEWVFPVGKSGKECPNHFGEPILRRNVCNLRCPISPPTLHLGEKIMTREKFWFATGAVAGIAAVGGALAARRFAQSSGQHVLRLEKSINIGRPVDVVFGAWASLERLPQWIDFITRIDLAGKRSRWRASVDGKDFQWDARITQFVPSESIGWKSINGPKHTGRVTFSPLGEQTVVHVVMNYAPPSGALGAATHVEDWIERGLREFKAALESGKHLMTSA